jgi:hypothetical protein
MPHHGKSRLLSSMSMTAVALFALCFTIAACNSSVDESGPDGGAGGSGGTGGGGGGGGGSGGDGRGMDEPWVELQAEDAQTNATIIGPSRTKWDQNHIEAEAIGRRAVRLTNTGDYVKFTTTQAANSLVVRYSIPDAPGGGGVNATLGLYIDGTRVKDLPLTSHYAWSYKGGLLDVPAVTLDTPAEQPHTFFDEIRLGPDIFPNGIPVGAEVKLQRDANDNAPFYVIDLVDFEKVGPPLAMPAGFTSVTQLGVVPDDPSGTDYADVILNAIQSTPKLWFPKGRYKLQKISSQHVGLDNPGHEIRGAGMWYTELDGAKAMFFCNGAVSCVFGDFSIRGVSTARNEGAVMSAPGFDAAKGDGQPQKAFAGPMGVSSLIENVWIEHTVAGIWVGNDPANQPTPTDQLTIRNCRIRNTYADGINLDNGTTNTLIENCHMRNTGDDSVAIWSIKWTDWVRHGHYPPAPTDKDQGVEHGNRVHKVSVQMPWRANCFAVYGGNDNHFSDSICEDVLTYPGILVDHEFSPYPFGPALTTFKNILVARAGGEMFFETTANPWYHGALKFYMREGDVNDILVQDVDIVDPTYAGIEFRGYGSAYLNGETQPPDIVAAADVAKMANVALQNVKVTGAGTYCIEARDGASRGSVNFTDVTVSGCGMGALYKGIAPDSFFNKVSGNQGW